MKINDFSSYFEIFTVLNVAYASFETVFNYTLNSKILVTGDLDNFLSEIKNLLKAEYSSLNFSRGNVNFDDDPELVKDYDGLAAYVNKFGEFPKSFKSIFLLGFLYCLFTLLFGGFNYCFSNLALMSLFIIFTGLYFFWRSFDENRCDKSADANLLVLLMIPFILSSLIFSLEIEDKFAATLACVAGASAFIFYFLRAGIYNFKVVFRIADIRKKYIETAQRSDEFKFLHLNERQGYFEGLKQTYRELQSIKANQPNTNL